MLDTIKRIARGAAEKHPIITGVAAVIGIATVAKTVAEKISPTSTAQTPPSPGTGG